MSAILSPKIQRTIFMIDDDLDMLELNRTILEYNGYKVLAVQSGKEALFVLNRIEPPYLVLLDYNLQDMEGPEFLKLFERKNPKLFRQIPIVFLTSKSEIPNTKAIGFIKKSSNMDGFLTRVDRYIQRSIESVTV